jgi:hypothetical protein
MRRHARVNNPVHDEKLLVPGKKLGSDTEIMMCSIKRSSPELGDKIMRQQFPGT